MKDSLDFSIITIGPLASRAELRQAAANANTPYVFLRAANTRVLPGTLDAERFAQVAEVTGAVMLYSDYREEREGELLSRPTIEYQPGSLRDDFDFGPL
ncbi:MAG: glycosyltransferase family 2 protein, partial [Odoribacteraceae bacterium]|nr:glycosyltransferase family 2 protein [Odoribacteraceae bacterium]